MTTETLKILFDIDEEVNQNYSHGFIDKKAFLPSSFCELGIKRFKLEYSILTKRIQMDISESLWFKSQELGREFVIPDSLNHFLE